VNLNLLLTFPGHIPLRILSLLRGATVHFVSALITHLAGRIFFPFISAAGFPGNTALGAVFFSGRRLWPCV